MNRLVMVVVAALLLVCGEVMAAEKTSDFGTLKSSLESAERSKNFGYLDMKDLQHKPYEVL